MMHAFYVSPLETWIDFCDHPQDVVVSLNQSVILNVASCYQRATWTTPCFFSEKVYVNYFVKTFQLGALDIFVHVAGTAIETFYEKTSLLDDYFDPVWALVI